MYWVHLCKAISASNFKFIWRSCTCISNMWLLLLLTYFFTKKWTIYKFQIWLMILYTCLLNRQKAILHLKRNYILKGMGNITTLKLRDNNISDLYILNIANSKKCTRQVKKKIVKYNVTMINRYKIIPTTWKTNLQNDKHKWIYKYTYTPFIYKNWNGHDQ